MIFPRSEGRVRKATGGVLKVILEEMGNKRQLETSLDLAKERNQQTQFLKLSIINSNSQRKLQNKTLKCGSWGETVHTLMLDNLFVMCEHETMQQLSLIAWLACTMRAEAVFVSNDLIGQRALSNGHLTHSSDWAHPCSKCGNLAC